MESSAIRAYEIFRELNLPQETAKEIAEIIVNSKDESLSRWVANKDDVIAIKEDIAALDMKIASVRTELKEDIAAVKSSVIWWFAGISVALLGIVLTMMKFVM